MSRDREGKLQLILEPAPSTRHQIDHVVRLSQCEISMGPQRSFSVYPQLSVQALIASNAMQCQIHVDVNLILLVRSVVGAHDSVLYSPLSLQAHGDGIGGEGR